MVDKVQQYSISQIQKSRITYKRYFFNEVDFDQRMIGVIGDRGIGKSTFLLQYLKELNLPYTKKLYVSSEFLLLCNISRL